MVVIWGLDLHEFKWYKFGSKYMFGNTDYHLRRTKFVVYQLSMILVVVSESLGTAVLSDLIDRQRRLARFNPNAYLYNNDYVGIASFNIFVGIFNAFIFGAAFFFDLFWPARHESPGVRRAWRICSVLSCIMMLADALALTVITARHVAYITGTSQAEINLLAATTNMGPIAYRNLPRAIAAVCFIWPGFIATIASTIVLWMSYHHDDKVGPLSTHARMADKSAGDEEASFGSPDIPMEQTTDGAKDLAINGAEHEPGLSDYEIPAVHRTISTSAGPALPVEEVFPDQQAASPISTYRGHGFSPYNGEA